MKFEKREYQETTIQKVINCLDYGENALISAPTGAGKAYILAKVSEYFLRKIDDFKVLILMDREILVKQLQETFKQVNNNIKTGICCASLNLEKEIDKQVTIATRQSIINVIENLPKINLIIIDEAHLLGLYKEGKDEYEGQFRQIIKFLSQKNPKIRLFGCTATPYTLQHGWLFGTCNKPGYTAYFKKITHKISYDNLIKDNYLCQLKGEIQKNNVNLDDVPIASNGDFKIQELSEEMILHVKTLEDAINNFAKDRKHILIFCVNIEHVLAVKQVLKNSVEIHSQQNKHQRKMSLKLFKSGRVRIAISVNILSIGFDFSAVDCIILARPTTSPALCLQQIGRGLRIHSGKENCLLIDVTGNVKKHFPKFDLDRPVVNIPDAGKTKEKEPPAKKVCPECLADLYLALKICPECGFEFPDKFIEEYKDLPEMESINFKKAPPELPKIFDVLNIYPSIHTSKKSGKKLLKIELTYYDKKIHPESVYIWLCLPDYYSGYAVQQSKKKWRWFSDTDLPENLQDAIEIASNFIKPDKMICKKKDTKFYEVLSLIYDLDEIPF